MAQDNTPAIVMYKGPQEDGYSIPFDKGYYGEVKVAFVRRGLTDYEYEPTTYTVDGALYAWEVSAGVYYYTKSATPIDGALVYDAGNHEISGVVVVSTQNASASFSDGKTGIRSNKQDIHSHALLFWTGEPLGGDDWICIVRETVKKQPYSYPNNQKHIEGALDNLSRQIQELKAQSEVSLKVDPTFVQDPQKMNPIDWLNTIVRSTDTTARGLRYRNFWLEYSTDDPNKAENDKSWTKLLNTTNITSVREWYDEDNNVYIPQYSMDGGVTWKQLGAVHLIEDLQEQIDELKENVYTKTEIDDKFTVANAQIDANADAIQRTREGYIQADSEIHQILNNHAENLTTLHNDVDDLGDQVAEIESKIPESASGSNPLVTKQQLLDEELDIRDDLNEGLSELQTQVTHQAAEIATKQDQLTAGDNIIISGNVISATGAGGGAGFDAIVVQELPETGQKGVIYLLAKDGVAPDVYDEYVWIESTQTFELIGTTQVDLTDYVKNTDYATSSKGGVIKVNSTSCAISVTASGLLYASTKSLSAYNDAQTTIFIGKGTLENIKDDLVARAIENAVTTQNLTVGSGEGTLYIGDVAGTATIATNNGLDIAAQTKFDTAPTTDDNTTYANALDTSLVRKAQVATAIADAVANIDALPDQTGNAGKVLTTDGTTASWQDPSGGTTITLKEYDE